MRKMKRDVAEPQTAWHEASPGREVQADHDAPGGKGAQAAAGPSSQHGSEGEDEPTSGGPAQQGPEAERPEASATGGTSRRSAAGFIAAQWRRIPRQVKWTVSLVILFFVFEYVILPELANASHELNALRRVNFLWLSLAVVMEILALACYAQLSHTVLSPGAPRRLTLFRVNMSALAVSHVLPGGTASGTPLAYRLLVDEGVPGSTAGFGLATQGMGSAVVLNALFWLALLVSIPLSGYNPLYGFAALAGVIFLTIFAGIVYLLTRGQRQAGDFLHRVAERVPLVNPDAVSTLVQKVADRLQILLRDRGLLRNALLWAAGNWLFDAASLWVFVAAFGHIVSPIDLLVAYGLANILAVIPITPGGLGVVELVLVSTLTGFHVPRNLASIAVLCYRLVNFWLPIPIGGIAYLSLRVGNRKRQHAADSAPTG